MTAPLVTVHTPCRNGARTLQRVFGSLLAQTRADLEWVVVDDGSIDGSAAVAEGFAARAPFDVRIHRFEEHQGKPTVDNRGVAMARGRFLVVADADDAFIPGAMATFLAAWDAIPEDARDGFAGITARCQDESGRPLGAPYPRDPFDATLLDLAFRVKNRTEKWHFMRTDVMRAHPFPEPDYYVPENVVWLRIGEHYRNRCINATLRIYHTGGGESVSKGPLMKYHRGLAYGAMYHLNHHLKLLAREPVALGRLLVNYARYNRHAGRRLADALEPLHGAGRKTLCAALYPVGAAVARWDQARGKVRDESGPSYTRFDAARGTGPGHGAPAGRGAR